MHSRTRREFASWLRSRSTSGTRNVAASRHAFKRHISLSSAYRAAVDVGLKGARRNRSRYAQFWAEINWKLPDGKLAAIWQVHRSNIRARRLRLGAGGPRWRTRYDFTLPSFATAVDLEQQKARSFGGARPDPAQRKAAVAEVIR